MLHPSLVLLLQNWKRMGWIRIQPITERDRFDVNGFGGKAVAEGTLVGARIVARELPPYRVAIYAPNDLLNSRAGGSR